MQKVLICGSTGFIGRNIAERLKSNPDLEIYGQYHQSPHLQQEDIRPIQANLLDSIQVTKVISGMDVIIQAAATTSGSADIVSRPHLHVTDNAVMNSLLLRAASDQSIPHVIFLSCSVMYPSFDRPCKEDDFLADGIHPRYFGVGWTKVYIEQMCRFFSTIGNTRFTVIRHSNIYGPHDKFDFKKSHVMGATIAKVMSDTKGEVEIWGSGEERRDLLFVDDLIDFIENAIKNQQTPFELINVGSGTTVSVRDLAELIISVSEKDIKILHDLTKPSIDANICLDISKAKKVFNWQPKTTLTEGISKTLDWYRQNYTQK